MKVKNPILLIQSILAAVQLVVQGSNLDNLGLSHKWAFGLGLVVAAAQFGVATYQHGTAKSAEQEVSGPKVG